MQAALTAANQAASAGEVPVGAACYDPDGNLLATAANAPIANCDPSAHAEMLCLRQAANKLGNYRLNGCSLYVTLEPCPMCAGLICHARIALLGYAIADPKTGAAGSVVDLFSNKRLNHHTEVIAGLCQQESQQLLRNFFAQRRWNQS